jgi:trehalose transport system substrate-binding protein
MNFNYGVEFLADVMSNLVAGLLVAAILTGLVYLSRKLGPKRAQQWANRLRRLGWPLLTFVCFATALMSAIFRGVTGPPLITLAIILVFVSVSFILFRFGPPKIRHLATGMQVYAWQILAGIFFLTTVMLLLIDTGKSPFGDRIVFVIDLADQEMMAFRDVLDELEPQLGSKIFLMSVDSNRHVARLDKMVASGDIKWDLIAVDNNVLGILVKKDLVEELTKYRKYDRLIPLALLPSLRPMLKFEDRFYFAPFRPNVKIAFYNEEKFAQYGLKPPKTWKQLLEVAGVFKEKEGVGRVAIHGYPGKATALTVFEFVKAAGGNPLTLDDDGSKRAFTFLQQLEPYLAPEYAETKFDTANEFLLDDDVYLVSNWTYGIKVVVEHGGKREIKVYSGWRGPAGEVHALGGDVLAVPKGAPHPNRAIKLIELLLSKETQQKLVSRLHWPAARQDVYDEIPPEMAPYFHAVNEALSFAAVRPTEPHWPMVEKHLVRAFQKLVREGNHITSLEEHSASLKEIPSGYVRYRVELGDTLAAIAGRHNTSAAILADINRVTSPRLPYPGQVLLIPR